MQLQLLVYYIVATNGVDGYNSLTTTVIRLLVYNVIYDIIKHYIMILSHRQVGTYVYMYRLHEIKTFPVMTTIAADRSPSFS